MISAQIKLVAEQIYSKMLDRTDDVETFLFERGIFSLRRKQFNREEQDGARDHTIITL